MNEIVKKEVEELIKKLELNCSIKEFRDKVDWYYISWKQKLSKHFIREFKDKVNWDYISSYQKLSEHFIREFKDLVDWRNISHHQELSEQFIREFKDKLNIDTLVERKLITKDRLKELDKEKHRYICSLLTGSNREYRFKLMDLE